MQSRKVIQNASVKTNPKRGSVASCSSVGIVPVTFQELWDNFYGEKEPPYKVNGEVPEGFENQCAIRMSLTFHRVGVQMITFSSKYVKPENKEASIGRLLFSGLATSTRANELAQWLNTRPICGIGSAQNITGKDWKSKIKGKTGIIYFDGFWARDGLEEINSIMTGGHIDLWNKSELTPSRNNLPRFLLGIDSMNNIFYQYSDYGKSKRILFFEVK